MTRPHSPSQELLTQLYESMTDGVVCYGEDDQIVFCNPGMCVITGRSLEEILGRTSMEAWGVTINFPDSLHASAVAEQAIKRPNGMMRYVSVKTFPLAGTGGLRVAIYRDVTRNRNAMESMRRAEERLHDLLEAVPVILWTADINLLVTSSLGSGLDLIKYRPNEHQGQILYRFFRTEDPDFGPIFATMRALQGKPQRLHFEMSGRHYDATISPIRSVTGEVTGTVGIAIDTTDRVRTREDLETTTREYKLLFNDTSVGNFVFSPTGRLLNCNNVFLRIFGYESSEAARRNINLQNWLTPSGANGMQVLVDSRSIDRQEFIARRGNGTQVHLEVSVSGRFDDDGTLIVAQGSVIDLTLARKMERTIARAETHLRGVLALTGVALVHLSARGRVIDLRADGLPRHAPALQDLHGGRIKELLPQHQAALLEAAMEKCIEGSTSEEVPLSLQLGGKTVPFRGRLSRVGEAEFVLLLQDPPAESAGEIPATNSGIRFSGLLGPIAHELNNYLMGILGHAGLAMMDVAPDAPPYESLRSIERTALDASQFTSQLLSGTWPVTDSGILPLQSLLRRLAEATAPQLPSNISLKTVMKDSVPPVRGVADQLLIMLNSLMDLGTRRLRGSGEIHLEVLGATYNAGDLHDCLGDTSPRGGEYAVIRVTVEAPEGGEDSVSHSATDAAIEESRSIATCLGIIRAHKGYIRCSLPRRGAMCYEVLLPAARMKPGEVNQGAASLPLATRSGESPRRRLVLVGDAEGVSTSAAVTVLADCGLDYLRANDRAELLDSFRRNHERLVAVLLDGSLLMDETGPRLPRDLSAINEDVPVLVSADPLTRMNIRPCSNIEFLDSPLHASEFAEKLGYFQRLRGLRLDTT